MPFMRIVEELVPVGRARQLRHTFVQGADGNHYKILTMRLYDFPTGPEFATHETSVTRVNELGARRDLVQPFLKRFFSEREALDFHQDLLERFDETLRLNPPPKAGGTAP